jgi:carbonic anhydrase
MSAFDDVLEANRGYAERFELAGLAAPAAQGLAVLTCIDSRIEPLSMLGLQPGDAKILRNAGARVTEDAIRSLTLATNLLNVSRIMIVAHTDCAMAGSSEAELRARLAARNPEADFRGVELHAATDQLASLAADVELLRACPRLHRHVIVGGFVYDVGTGLLRPA